MGYKFVEITRKLNYDHRITFMLISRKKSESSVTITRKQLLLIWDENIKKQLVNMRKLLCQDCEKIKLWLRKLLYQHIMWSQVVTMRKQLLKKNCDYEKTFVMLRPLENKVIIMKTAIMLITRKLSHDHKKTRMKINPCPHKASV